VALQGLVFLVHVYTEILDFLLQVKEVGRFKESKRTDGVSKSDLLLGINQG